MNKTCNVCHITKSVNEFYRCRNGYQCRCIMCDRARTIRRYKENPEKFKQKRIDYYYKNLEVEHNRFKEWAKKNKDKRLMTRKRYVERHKEQVRLLNAAISQRRRARKNNVYHEDWDKYEILIDQQGMCPCGDVLSIWDFIIHHVIKLKDGGDDAPHNLVALHERCHYRHHWDEDKDYIVEQYMQERIAEQALREAI